MVLNTPITQAEKDEIERQARVVRERRLDPYAEETLTAPLAAWNARRNSADIPNRPRPLTKVRVRFDGSEGEYGTYYVEGDNGTIRPVNRSRTPNVALAAGVFYATKGEQWATISLDGTPSGWDYLVNYIRD